MDSKFNLYTRNNLHDLAFWYSSERKRHPGQFRQEGAFAKDIVVVPTNGMAAWLSQQLVNDGHVVMNFAFPFIQGAIGDMLKANFNGHADYRPELFSPEVLVWRIYGILMREDGGHSALSSYMKMGGPGAAFRELRCFQLSSKLANLYAQYQAFIPDMLHPADGATRNGEDWQLRLWDDLCMMDGEHVVSPAEALMDVLARNPEDVAPLPPITLFGFSAMSPFYLRLLKKLACRTSVNLFYHNICDEFWGDQMAEWERNRQKDAVFAEPDSLELHFQNTLLGNMGMQGRNFFKAIMELDNDVQEHEWHQWIGRGFSSGSVLDAWTGRPEGELPLLAAIQSRIARMSDLPEEGAVAVALAPWDDSLTVHKCFNEMREVEALHDCILKLIKERGYAMNDIIVMAPDIGVFAPAIHAVFDNGQLASHYCISDRSVKGANKIAETFMGILGMGRCRFEVSKVGRLLDSGHLRKRFGFDGDALPRIREWIANAGIRWGKDGVSRKDMGAGAFEEYSWRYGLDRLLLSIAAGTEPASGSDGSAPGFAGLAPVAFEASEDNLNVLSGLCGLFDSLCDFVSLASELHTGLEWCERIKAFLPVFFLADNESGASYGGLAMEIDKLAASLKKAGLGDCTMPFDVARAALASSMERMAPAQPFLNGKITFCSMQPMRSIPCKVIAVLGMDEGEFPRGDEAVGFSLMDKANLMRYYDRARPAEDRYIFLETLLAAQDYLMFFYHGKDDRRLCDYLPATPLAELLEYAGRVRTMPKEPEESKEPIGGIIRKHRLNGFDKECFRKKKDKDPCIKVNGYDGGLRRAFSFNHSYAAIAESALENGQKQPGCTTKLMEGLHGLPPMDPPPYKAVNGALSLDLKELAMFLKGAAGMFLRVRLGYPRPEREKEEMTDFEPFALDRLRTAIQCRRIGKVELEYNVFPDMHDAEDPDKKLGDLYQTLRANCQLPVGEAGKAVFRAEIAESWISDETFRKEWAVQKKENEKDYGCELRDVPVRLPDGLKPFLDNAVFGGPMEAAPEERTLAVKLHGRFASVQGRGLRECFYSKRNGSHIVEPYLCHLMKCACADGEQIETILLWQDGDGTVMPPVSREEARNRLKTIVNLYLAGFSRPLPISKSPRHWLLLQQPKRDKTIQTAICPCSAPRRFPDCAMIWVKTATNFFMSPMKSKTPPRGQRLLRRLQRLSILSLKAISRKLAAAQAHLKERQENDGCRI